MQKTNAMRMLDKAKMSYDIQEYEVDENDLSGVHVAAQIGQNPETVFKTLVARGEKRGVVVMCLPVDKEIDLKKAARAIGDKKIEMAHVKELLSLTGYIRGGCSPVGMKKKYPTWFHLTALEHDKIAVSAGVRGAQIIMRPAELINFIGAETADLCKEE